MPAFDDIALEGTRFLGLDLGLRLGYALLDHRGRRLQSGTMHFTGSGTRRAHVARRRIDQLLRALNPTHMAIETVAGHTEGAILAAHVWGGIQWLVMAAAHPRSIEEVTVAEVKRAATGRGGGKQADKQAVMAAARVRWGAQSIGDDNEADAHWIAEVLRRRVASRG
jgi:Holliday junction resolvasome RuvABC endonuclease subunit